MNGVLFWVVISTLLIAAVYGWRSGSKKHPGVIRPKPLASSNTNWRRVQLLKHMDELKEEFFYVRYQGVDPGRQSEIEKEMLAIKSELFILDNHLLQPQP